MSDSDKTNELDNYGVWVKKPPRTVSSEIESDLPDFSAAESIDDTAFDSGDTALSADELANLTGALSEEPSPAASGDTEEISLDEFIEGGVFEGDDTASSPAAEESSAPAPAQEESVSLDDFMDTSEAPSDIAVSDEPTISEPASLSVDDGPIDIDLSFDDSAPSIAPSEPAAAPVAAVSGSEEIDLSDFGVDFGDSGGAAAPATEPAASDDGAESVDLSDFGVDFSEPSESPAAEESTSTGAPATDESGMEEISLDSFGFDINAEESTEEEAAPAASEATEEESPSLSAEESVPLSEPQAEPEVMSVTADDDVGDISLDADTSAPSAPSAQPAGSADDFSSPDEDDFDLDSIMDSIEDENGNTTSLNDEGTTEATENTESIEESVPAEEVPATVDVVDMDEPVFEETAVDIPEAEDSNPFELPPDNAFAETASAPVESAPLEEPAAVSDEITLPEEEPVIEDSEPVTQTAPAPAEEENPAPVQSEVKQDSEISAATSAILSQIVSELSSLRSEISGLKNDFEELKNKEPVAVAPQVQEEPDSPAPQEAASGGFFDNTEEDETIALSLDEMDNILNSVEMVEDTTPALPAEEEVANTDAESTIDFSNENLEEPVLDDLENDSDDSDAPEELPDEILVPKTDDILVESSQENLIDEEPASELPADIDLTEEPKLDSGASETVSAEDSAASYDLDNFSFDDSSEEILPAEELSDDTALEEVTEEPIEEAIPAEDASDDAEEIPAVEEAVAQEEPVIEETVAAEDNDSSLIDEPFVFEDEAAASDAPIEAESPATDSDAPAEAPAFEEDAEDTTAAADTEAFEESAETIAEDEPEEDSNESEENSVAISETELDRLLAEDRSINDSLTDENLNYLADDAALDGNPSSSIPHELQKEIKSVLSYMDQLLENLPEEKIAEFAQSEQFETYKKLFKELGLE
ncbi:MAG: hypothetical protein IJ558_00965 [Treponema sp.]|nr:hypothetical protein [Treponema sp.]